MFITKLSCENKCVIELGSEDPQGVSSAPRWGASSLWTTREDRGGLWIWDTLLLKPSSWWWGGTKAQFDHCFLARVCYRNRNGEKEVNPRPPACLRLPRASFLSGRQVSSDCVYDVESWRSRRFWGVTIVTTQALVEGRLAILRPM